MIAVNGLMIKALNNVKKKVAQRIFALIDGNIIADFVEKYFVVNVLPIK